MLVGLLLGLKGEVVQLGQVGVVCWFGVMLARSDPSWDDSS